MNKRIASLFLLLSLLLSLLPLAVTGAAASEPEGTPIAGEVLTGEDLYYREGLVAFLIADEEWVTVNDDGSALWRDSLTGTVYQLSGQKTSMAATVTVQMPAVKDIPHDGTKEYVKVTYAEDGTTPLYRVTTTLYYSTTADPNVYYTYTHTIDNVLRVIVKQVMKGEVYDPASGTYTQDTSVADLRLFGWELTDRGLGYTMPDFFAPNYYRTTDMDRTAFSIDLGRILPEDEYTLEWVSGYTGYVDTDGYSHSMASATMYQGDGDWSYGFFFGPLKAYTRPNAAPGIYAAWMAYTETGNIAGNQNRIQQITTLQGEANMTNLTLDKIATGDGNYTYDWRSNGKEVFSMTTGEAQYTTGGTVDYIPNDRLSEGAAGNLILNSDIPGYTYAIRIYDRVLTEAQKIRNHFADLACFYDFDLAQFSAMTQDQRALLMEQMYSYGFSSDPANAQSDLDAAIKGLTYKPSMNVYDQLYVQDGLTILLTAYDPENEDTISINSTGSGKWMNKILNEDGSFDTFFLNGRRETRTYIDENRDPHTLETGWRAFDNGIGYEITQAAVRGTMNGSHYLDFGLDQLPDGNYTVEVILQDMGMPMEGTETATWLNGDQGKNWYGDWDYLFKVGNFALYANHTVHTEPKGISNMTSITTSFSTNGDWNHPGEVKLLAEQYRDCNYTEVGIYNATFKLKTNTDGSIDAAFSLGLHGDGRYKGGSVNHPVRLAEAGSFRMFADVPSTVYAIRVYDHALSSEEQLQNHFADLCAYHQLDLGRFSVVSESDRLTIYRAWAGYDFTTDRATLQSALDNALSVILLNFEGFAAKTEGVGNELAAIFSLNLDKISGVEAQGYKVTAGVLMAPQGEALRAFDDLTVESAFKSHVVYTTSGGKSGMIGQTDKFGYSVFFDQYTRPDELCKKYVFRAYVTLEKDGETLTYYNNAQSGNFGHGVSMLDLCNYLINGIEKYKSNETLLATANGAYTELPLYVDAKNGSDSGDGSRGAPFKTLTRAFEEIDSLLSKEGIALNVILNVLTGDYFVDEALTLDGKDYAREYKLQIKGNDATLSGNYEIPLSSFTPVDGTDQISHRIPEKYRDQLFRSFYADGKLATLATTEEKLMTRSFTYFTERAGERKFADEAYENENGNIYFVAYVDRSLIDQYFPVEEIRAGNVDIAGTELWIRIEWYYMGFRIVDIDFDHSLGSFATVDNAATTISNKNYDNMYALVLNYSDASTYTKFRDGVMRPQHDVARELDYATLKNSVYLLDEPGEYYYDLESGYVSYIPKSGDKTAGLSTLENLLVLKNLSNVSISGLSFTGTSNNSTTEDGHISNQAGWNQKINLFGTEAAIYGQNLTNLTLADCDFYELYASGIVLRGVNVNILITGNSFEEIGASSILVGDPAGWNVDTNAHTNLKIENNYMHNIATVFYEHCAITVTKAQNLSICFNSIINCSYTGISVGWGWSKSTAEYGTFVNVLGAEIAYNYIENYMRLMSDGGAIYVLSGNATIEYDQHFNFMHDNYLYCGSTEEERFNKTWGACYHDGSASHWYTYNNVVWVDANVLSQWSFLCLQGADEWNTDHQQQVYNILLENNFILNVSQDYKTCGWGRLKNNMNLYEVNSHILTLEDVFETAARLEEMQLKGELDRNGQKIRDHMLVDPDSFDFVDPALVDEMNGIVTTAGCDGHKGEMLLEYYEALYKTVENPGEKPY